MEPKKKTKISAFWKLIIFAAVFAAIGASIQYVPRLLYRAFGDMWLEPQAGGLSPAELERVRQATGSLPCRVVWSSSRSGNHELYMLRLPSGELYRLTTNEFVDYFPRFSPDGQKLVFARSQRNWVSERDYDQWDVWQMDLNDGSQKLVAQNGNFPLWVDDHRVSFLRGHTVVLRDLATGAEKVLYDGRGEAVGGRIETPMLSPTDENLLAVTARGQVRGCLVLRLPEGKALRDFGDGCEIIFGPGGKQVVWMENGGIGGNRVMASPADKVEPRVLMDLPGDFSHEYFPRLSPDGKWLVWAASAGEHEHDIADYEIFIWQVGQPFESAARLTRSKANDRWPDIYLD